MNPWDGVEAWKSEKDFLNWLRSQTRRIWSRHPVKISYKVGRRFKSPIGKNDKEVWACHCEMCNELVRSSDTEIDHMIAGGSFDSWETYTQWAKRILWVTLEDIRELCKDCHEVVTLSQKLGITLEESRVEKSVLKIIKEKKDKQFLEEKGIKPASNAKTRREQLREYFNDSLQQQHERP